MDRSGTLRLPPPAGSAHGSGAASAFAAQLAGQPGARRGLLEGAPALDRARRAYLSAEWAGPHDRRPEAGLLKRVSL